MSERRNEWTCTLKMGEELSKKRALLRLHFWRFSGLVLLVVNPSCIFAFGLSVYPGKSCAFTRNTSRAVAFWLECLLASCQWSCVGARPDHWNSFVFRACVVAKKRRFVSYITRMLCRVHKSTYVPQHLLDQRTDGRSPGFRSRVASIWKFLTLA